MFLAVEWAQSLWGPSNGHQVGVSTLSTRSPTRWLCPQVCPTKAVRGVLEAVAPDRAELRRCATPFNLSISLDISFQQGLSCSRNGRGPVTAASVLGLCRESAAGIASSR